MGQTGLRAETPGGPLEITADLVVGADGRGSAVRALAGLEIEDLGYNVIVDGQKTYNGVAILSKTRPEDVRRGLPGNGEDTQARYIEALIPSDSGMVNEGTR